IPENSAGFIRGSVERYFYFDPSFSADDLHPLIGSHLGATGEYGVSRWKVHYSGGENIGSHFWIPLYMRHHSCGLFSKNQPRGVNQVTANIHQRAAPVLGDVPDVLRITIEITEISHHRSDRS